jgi:hypothetical protein
MVNSTHMAVHGGRSEVYGSFADVWLFSLEGTRWQPMPQATAALPAARDQHALAAYGGKLLMFGGRFSPAPGMEAAARPLGDRWLFDLASRSWRMLPVRGLSPLPRFLFAYAQYAPAVGGPDQLLVFGGQTGSGCKLNDVWVIELGTYHWRQLSLATFASRQCQQLFG